MSGVRVLAGELNFFWKTVEVTAIREQTIVTLTRMRRWMKLMSG